MKRNANAVSALLTNFDIAEKALLESQNAAGSALAENEKYLDSINGKLDQLKASWEQLSASVLDSEVVKGAIDLIRGLIDAFNKLDEATDGVSSNIVAFGTAFIVVRSVLSAFKMQAADTTSVLGTLVGLLSKDSRTASITKLGSSFELIATAMRHIQEAGGGWLHTILSLIPAGGKVVLALAAVAAAIYGIKKAYSAYRAEHPTFEDLQEQSEELKAEVDELSSSVETANERIAELQKLADAGTISLTEQDELNRLRTQNDLLEAQLRFKQALLDVNEAEKHDKAVEDASEFFSTSDITAEAQQRDIIAANTGNWNAFDDRSSVEKLNLYRQSIQHCDQEIQRLTLSLDGMDEKQAEAVQNRIKELEQQKKDALALFSSTAEPLNALLESLDPSKEEDAGIIKQIKAVTYQMEMLSGDATALKSVFDDFWSDAASNPGIDKFKEKLEAAVKVQAEYNEQLKRYGGNIDLTNRPHVTVTQDMIDNYGDLWPQESLGTYSTVNSLTYSADELGLSGSQAIVVTPIAPDGSILGDYYTMKDYVLEHCVEDGKLVADNGEGDVGVTMAIVDKGNINDSIIKANEIAQAAHNANAAFHDLQETSEWEGFLSVLSSVGINVNELSQADLAAMFEAAADAAEEATSSLSGVAAEVDKLTEKHKLLKTVQDEFNSSGVVSASTLSSVVEKFPELSESVGMYLAGLKTGKELIQDLSAAYQADVNEYKDALRQKLAASPEFYNSLTSQQKQLIDDLANSYDVDLWNFKTVEQAKLNFQAEIIKKLALNYQRYSGASLEQLKDYRANLRQAISNAQWNPELYSGDFVPSRQAELKEVEAAIKAIEDGNTRLDGLINGNLESWDPSQYGDKSSSSSSDSYKKSVEEKINALKHQLAMEKITASQYYDGLEAIEKQYYKDSAAHAKKYADEIRSIDEELFNGRRELNEDWLNDQQDFAERAGSGGDYTAQQDYYNGMYSKLQEMIKAAKDYGLDESSDYVQELYDKVDQLQSDILASVKASFDEFESYMDDFDLWKGSDFSKLDYLQYRLKQIIALYDKGQLSWTQYTEARNEIAKQMYDTQRDSLEEILDLTMDMIKQEAEDQVDALDKQVDAYQKIIDKKKELLQDSADEADHEEQVAEKVKEIAELQSKIAQLSLDDSREAAAKKASLEQDLYTAQKELADLQRDYSLDQTLEALDKSQEAFEDEKEAEKDAVEESVDSWQKLYEKAIKRIEGDWDGLYKDLTRYEAEHRDSIDGPDSLVTAWKNATAAMQEYNNSFEDAYNNAGINAINPNANQSAEAQAILQKMNDNSALAKALGTSKIGTPGTAGYRDLHQENIDYAQQYYELTGQRLKYDSTAGWKYDNSTSGNTINSNKQNTTQTNTSKAETSSEGSAYKATKSKYNMDAPSGTLKEGVSKGKDVEWLQYYLKQLGYFPYAVDGQFYSRTKQALVNFQSDHGLNPDGIYGQATRRKIPKYHTGGIVGNAGSINDTEVLALLKKGEWVLDDQRKQNLKSLFAGLKEATSGMMSATVRNRMQAMRPAAVAAGGDTFAPHIEVSIQHNGSMSDKDAKQYGNMVANTALEQLKSAFAKRGKF